MKKKMLKYGKSTDERLKEVSNITEDMIDDFYNANSMKITKDSTTTKQVHNELDHLADYILESENLTTKKNEYNILDKKRLKDVEINEQKLPSYSKEDDTTAEDELTNAIINKERLMIYEDTVYKLLQGDYELINDGVALDDMWFYQTLQNQDARKLVEDCFNLIQYYVMEMRKTRSIKGIKATRRKIKELLYGDISTIVRSNTNYEPMQKRSGVKANKNSAAIHFSEDIATNKHHYIFRMLVADKGSITNPVDIIPIVDIEQVISKGVNNGEIDNKDMEIIELLKNHYNGDLIQCLKVKGKYTTNRYRFEKLIKKLENIS
jgi:hypothetical protein